MCKFMFKYMFGIACVALSSAVFAASSDGIVRVTPEWKMSLGADGKITALELEPGRIKDALRDVLEAAIRSWEFVPGSINGKPASTETHLSLAVSLRSRVDGEGIFVKIDDVSTGGTIGKIGKLPYFSKTQIELVMEKKENQLVMLEVSYDESGNPGDIVVAENSPVKKG